MWFLAELSFSSFYTAAWKLVRGRDQNSRLPVTSSNDLKVPAQTGNFKKESFTTTPPWALKLRKEKDNIVERPSKGKLLPLGQNFRICALSLLKLHDILSAPNIGKLHSTAFSFKTKSGGFDNHLAQRPTLRKSDSPEDLLGLKKGGDRDNYPNTFALPRSPSPGGFFIALLPYALVSLPGL